MFSGAPGICHFYIVTGLAAAGVDTALPAFLLVTVPKHTKITVPFAAGAFAPLRFAQPSQLAARATAPIAALSRAYSRAQPARLEGLRAVFIP
tara:strand:+ start:963 stop:1241 length:279 start_codon:yes stop_codon:yes gene_type:complete